MIYLGTTIEGAVQEMVKVGPDDKPEWKPKYTMQQLLDQDFRIATAENQSRGREDSTFEDFVNFFEGGQVQGMKFDEVG